MTEGFGGSGGFSAGLIASGAGGEVVTEVELGSAADRAQHLFQRLQPVAELGDLT